MAVNAQRLEKVKLAFSLASKCKKFTLCTLMSVSDEVWFKNRDQCINCCQNQSVKTMKIQRVFALKIVLPPDLTFSRDWKLIALLAQHPTWFSVIMLYGAEEGWDEMTRCDYDLVINIEYSRLRWQILYVIYLDFGSDNAG
ncbi:MAG: hypothetical protein HHJ12_19455 [Glaciimonas sp.]|nr:hypothetical protein [Glaciimonas sp.]